MEDFLDHYLTRLIGVTTDVITIFGMIAALRFAALKKDVNIWSFRISLFLHYLVRICGLFILISISTIVSYFVYSIIVYNFSSSIKPNRPESIVDILILVIGLFFAIVIFFVLIWTLGDVSTKIIP